MFEWLINLPVWIQTPLLVVFALAACLALASLFHALLWRVVPPTEQEKSIAGYGVDGSVIKKLMLMKTTEPPAVTEEDHEKRNG